MLSLVSAIIARGLFIITLGGVTNSSLLYRQQAVWLRPGALSAPKWQDDNAMRFILSYLLNQLNKISTRVTSFSRSWKVLVYVTRACNATHMRIILAGEFRWTRTFDRQHEISCKVKKLDPIHMLSGLLILKERSFLIWHLGFSGEY